MQTIARHEKVRFFGGFLTGFFADPAPGVRHYSLGTLYNVAGYGYNWSLSVSGSSIFQLRYFAEGITPQFTTFRANGLPVRCLQE